MHVNPDRPPDAALQLFKWIPSKSSAELSSPVLQGFPFGFLEPLPTPNAAPSPGLTAWWPVAPVFSCNIVAASRILTRVVAVVVVVVEGPEACGRSDPGLMFRTSWVLMFATESGGKSLCCIENGSCLFHGWLVHFFWELCAQVSYPNFTICNSFVSLLVRHTFLFGVFFKQPVDPRTSCCLLVV